MRLVNVLVSSSLFLSLSLTGFASATESSHPISTPTTASQVTLVQTEFFRPQFILQQLQPEERFYSTKWSKALEDLQRAITTLAIIVGGFWAYFKFVKGRVYKPRLEPAVSGSIFTKDNKNYLLAEVSLKNVGLSSTEIQQKGSGLRVLSSKFEQDYNSLDLIDTWEHQATYSVFEVHGWLEPDETIEEQYLISLPHQRRDLALMLHFRIVSNGIEWNARKIIVL